MELHEYQAKKLLQEFGIPVPQFAVCKTMYDVEDAIATGDYNDVVLKAQILSGGRGKAGGVLFAKGRDSIIQAARNLLDKKIATYQTHKQQLAINSILLTHREEIEQELYFALMIDRTRSQVICMTSRIGGISIEETMKTNNNALLIEPITHEKRLTSYQLVRIAKHLGFSPEYMKKQAEIFQKLVHAFYALDCTMLEINPLVVCANKATVQILDCKMSIDDDAYYRQSKLSTVQQEKNFSTIQEEKAHQHGLAYITLDGTIGCVVNGAGLAMATLDLIGISGFKPANFLDVGGGASFDKVYEGFKIVLSDTRVSLLFVNIFGGIMDCTIIAKALLKSMHEAETKIETIVRLEGTHYEEAKKILQDEQFSCHFAGSLEEALKIISSIAHKRQYNGNITQN